MRVAVAVARGAATDWTVARVVDLLLEAAPESVATFLALFATPLCCDGRDAVALDDDEDESEEPDGAAAAWPAPETTAMPIPSATASPPIRPTYAPAPIVYK